MMVMAMAKMVGSSSTRDVAVNKQLWRKESEAQRRNEEPGNPVPAVKRSRGVVFLR